MARIFITGSTAGLGQLAAKLLINQGHQVVLHARSEAFLSISEQITGVRLPRRRS